MKQRTWLITGISSGFGHELIRDVTDVPTIHTLVDCSFEKFGRIDVIVSNAGYGLFGVPKNCVVSVQGKLVN